MTLGPAPGSPWTVGVPWRHCPQQRRGSRAAAHSSRVKAVPAPHASSDTTRPQVPRLPNGPVTCPVALAAGREGGSKPSEWNPGHPRERSSGPHAEAPRADMGFAAQVSVQPPPHTRWARVQAAQGWGLLSRGGPPTEEAVGCGLQAPEGPRPLSPQLGSREELAPRAWELTEPGWWSRPRLSGHRTQVACSLPDAQQLQACQPSREGESWQQQLRAASCGTGAFAQGARHRSLAEAAGTAPGPLTPPARPQTP